MSTLKVNTLTDTAATKSVPIEDVVNGTARAWVNFNGTTTPITIRASYNVSGITDNGTGNYTINFTTAMPDANYSTVFCGGDTAIAASVPIGYLTTTTTSAQTIRTYSIAGSLFDAPVINVSIFR